MINLIGPSVLNMTYLSNYVAMDSQEHVKLDTCAAWDKNGVNLT